MGSTNFTPPPLKKSGAHVCIPCNFPFSEYRSSSSSAQWDDSWPLYTLNTYKLSILILSRRLGSVPWLVL
jgi:hypothetical protein